MFSDIHSLQLHEKVLVLEGEKVALEKQLTAEKAASRGLETLLAAERKKVPLYNGAIFLSYSYRSINLKLVDKKRKLSYNI